MIILLIVLVRPCFSQTSIGFNNINATWNVASTFPAGDIQFPNFVSTKTIIYGFKGDTTMTSVLWNKMYVTGDSVFETSSNLKKVGYLRVVNKLVLFMDTAYKLDTLYNFNLNVGDSIMYNLALGNKYFHIINVDSVSVLNQNYKRLTFNKSTGGPEILTESWIENIGSIHGPLFPLTPRLFETEIPDSIYTTCTKIGNTVAWTNPNYKDCYVNIALSVKELSLINVNLYPNPASKDLIIKIPTSSYKDYVVSIYDLSGKPVINETYNYNGQIKISLNNLQNGFYILQVMSGDSFFRTKFIKQ